MWMYGNVNWLRYYNKSAQQIGMLQLLTLRNFLSLLFLSLAFLFYSHTYPSSPSLMAEESSKSVYDFTVKVPSFLLPFIFLCLDIVSCSCPIVVALKLLEKIEACSCPLVVALKLLYGCIKKFFFLHVNWCLCFVFVLACAESKTASFI